MGRMLVRQWALRLWLNCRNLNARFIPQPQLDSLTLRYIVFEVFRGVSEFCAAFVEEGLGFPRGKLEHFRHLPRTQSPER